MLYSSCWYVLVPSLAKLATEYGCFFHEIGLLAVAGLLRVIVVLSTRIELEHRGIEFRASIFAEDCVTRTVRSESTNLICFFMTMCNVAIGGIPLRDTWMKSSLIWARTS